MRIDKKTIKKRIAKAYSAVGGPFLVPLWKDFCPNFFYLTGSTINPAFLHVRGKSDACIYTPKINLALYAENYGNDFEVGEYKSASEIGKACAAGTGIDFGIPLALYKRLRVRGARDCSQQLLKLREKKDSGEISAMRKARQIGMGIMESLKVKGRTEADIAREIMSRIASEGCERAFPPIVANSRNARFPHSTPGRCRVGDFAVVDFGVRLGHYNSDVTRCLGDVSRIRGAYGALQAAALEIADGAYAGREVSDFVGWAGKVIRGNGLDDFPHSIGHGIGLEVHEYPVLRKKSNDVLVEDSVITIEPGQYNRIGMRYEDMFVVKKRGARLLA